MRRFHVPRGAGRPLGRLLGVLALLLGTATARAAPAQGNGQIRVVHAVAGVPAVDVLGDGQRVAAALAYGADTGYLIVPAGAHTVAVVAAGAEAAAPLATATLDLRAGEALTVVMVGPPGEPLVLADLALAPLGGPPLVRLAHLAPATPPLVLAREAGPPLAGPVGFGAASGYADAPTGAMTLLVRAADGGPPLATVLGAVLTPDRTYTFLAIPAPADGPALRLLALVDG